MGTLANGAVVVSRRELTDALRSRLSFDPAVRVFSSEETAYALNTILWDALPVVALDRRFANSGCGTEFMAQVRAARPRTEIRILRDEGSDIPLLLRRPVAAGGRAWVATHSDVLRSELRRTLRYVIAPGREALVNGARTALVNVSLAGVQLVSSEILRPSQQVRLSLATSGDGLRLQAAVAWSTFERSRRTGATYYRVGVEFDTPNSQFLELSSA